MDVIPAEEKRLGPTAMGTPYRGRPLGFRNAANSRNPGDYLQGSASDPRSAITALALLKTRGTLRQIVTPA